MTTSPSVYLDRLQRVRKAMADQGVDVLLLSLGHDLPYLTGYHAMPLERLTLLVVPRDADATLVVPRLEAPRVVEQPGVFGLRAWDETEGRLRVFGRIDDVIVSGGENVWPVAVERALATDARVREVAVVGRPDDVLGPLERGGAP